MSDQSLNGLLSWMQGKSITRGWDAVVTMNRAKVNQLLEQQYITRFNQNSFLRRIHGTVALTTDGQEVLELTGLLLSHPRLSFETASLADSRAHLTMDIVSGMVAYKVKFTGMPERITSSFAVTEQHRFTLTMDVDLKAMIGAVDQEGQVVLDLADGYDFKCNLVDLPTGQSKLGEFFRALFQRQPASVRRYVLGMLDFDPDDKLAPRNFYVRTQAAPEAKNASSDSYGEGAVVLFVRTRESLYDGSIPDDESDFRYLIPDDREAGTGKPLYSGSLILASRAVFDWFIHGYLQTSIGHDLSLQRISDSDDLARGLRAGAGSWNLGNIDTWFSDGINHYTMKSVGEVRLSFSSTADGSLPFEVTTVDGGLLKFVWKGSKTFTCNFTKKVGQSEKGENADLRVTHGVEFYLKAAVDPETSVVVFERAPGGASDFSVRKLNGDIEFEPNIAQHVESMVRRMIETMQEKLQNLHLPELDLFAINHLLFPDQNALLLTSASMPGDLALFGHIDPKHTAIKLEPSIVHVLAGTTQQFAVLEQRFKGKAGKVTWSVRTIDGSRAQGEIDQNGSFTAPPRERMFGQAVRNVVTATLEDTGSGQVLTSSALVIVVAEAMVVTPSMATVEIDSVSPEPVALKVSTLNGGTMKWSLRQGPGSLQANGDQAVYTPPASIEQRMEVAYVEAEDTSTGAKVSTTVVLVRGFFSLEVSPAYHPGLAPGATTRMRLIDQSVRDQVRWEVMAGEGTIDPATGEFTAPDAITMPYAVVTATEGEGSRAHRGYSIIYLSEYATEARWSSLRTFELKALSSSSLFWNGQQQVEVEIEVEPQPVDDIPVQVSETELNSIVLIDAHTFEPLPRVDQEGVPEGGGWAYNEESNGFLFYPDSRKHKDGTRGPGSRFQLRYIQTRAQSTKSIAAMLVRDDLIPFYSNQDANQVPVIIEPVPRKPPTFDKTNFEFESVRIEGEEENDYHLETVDYYVLRMKDGGQIIKLRHIEFEERSGMVQWESRQFEEDVVSFTGYALHGDAELRFDQGLYDHIPKERKPRLTLAPGHECPEGAVLISLHRTQYWFFNQACDRTYNNTVRLRVLDEYGNLHLIAVRFKTPTDRNELVVDV